MKNNNPSVLYEVVSGQILLSHREEFFELHSKFLLPAMKKIGIKPRLLLITEIGRYGRFLDVYEYKNFSDYDEKTSKLLSIDSMEEYYQNVGKCILGSITVELMRDLPYAKKWKS